MSRRVRFGRCGSTNDEAKRLAQSGAPAGTVVWAESQEGGRGRRGRTWVSPPGNLYCSLIIRPGCAAATVAQLSFVTALAVGDTLCAFIQEPSTVRFKWPNDVLLNERKVCGILLEADAPARCTALDWVVVGVGINLKHYPAQTEFPATALSVEVGQVPEVEAVLEAFLRHFQVWFDRWQGQGFDPIRATWLAGALGVGERISVRLHTQSLSGRFCSLDHDGTLILDQDGGGRQRIAAGDVFFAPMSGV
ncbi:Biotin--(acetyl-CoA-carboxylase) ligase [uncultured Gammaproteobacteria bacterium]